MDHARVVHKPQGSYFSHRLHVCSVIESGRSVSTGEEYLVCCLEVMGDSMGALSVACCLNGKQCYGDTIICECISTVRFKMKQMSLIRDCDELFFGYFRSQLLRIYF